MEMRYIPYTVYMKKFAIQMVFLVIVIFTGLYFTFKGDPSSVIRLPIGNSATDSATQAGSNASQLKIKDTVIQIDVADTTALRAQGLGGREVIPDDYGMLFIFPETKKHRFWMKGMKTNIDMIFIRQAKVVDMLANVPKPSQGVKDENLPIYEPIVPIDMVLETQSGFIAKHSIQVGDQVFLIE